MPAHDDHPKNPGTLPVLPVADVPQTLGFTEGGGPSHLHRRRPCRAAGKPIIETRTANETVAVFCVGRAAAL